MRNRLFRLLAVLAAVAVLFVTTRGWRRRLMEESARSRRVIAAVEQAQAAREQREAREKGLAAALQSHPGLVEVRLELAQLRWSEAGPAAAAGVLESGPPDSRILRLLAAAQRFMGREDWALATLDRAARLTPADGNLQAERATLFSLMGWFPQAEQALRDAIRRQADPLQITLVRVTMARQQGDLRSARRELEAAQRQSPNDPEVMKQLAAVAEAEGRNGEARQWLESVAKTDTDPEVWVALAKLELHQTEAEYGKVEEGGRVSSASVARARADLQRALALRPDMPAARRLMGRCLRLSGELTEARSVLERLYHGQPRQEGVAFELAQVYRDLGITDRLNPLMAQYQKRMRQREVMRRAAVAVMTHPDSAAAHREMGVLCLQRGMIGRAILSLQRAMTLDPRLPGVREALAAARRAAGTGSSAVEADAFNRSEVSGG